MITLQADPKDVEQIKKAFSSLADNVQTRIVRQVLSRNAQPLLRKMRELAPVSKTGGKSKKYPSRNHPAGYLKASIGIIGSRRGKYPTIWVRPRFTGRWDPWYEHFPMAGTSRMKKPPNPFVDRAWESTRATVEAGIASDMTRMIQERIDKL